MIVLDSSYTLALVMPDEARPASMKNVLEERLAAPLVWPLEIASAARMGMRRGRLAAADVEQLFQRIAALRVDVIAPAHTQPRRHFDASLEHELTPYDATYLVLAQQWTAALATRDAALAQAARRAGITLYE